MHGNFNLSSNKEIKKFKQYKESERQQDGKKKSVKTREREQSRKAKRELWNDQV